MIVTDLDGTLLREDKTVSERTIRTLRCVQDKGIVLVFASGRASHMMKLYREPLLPCDYQIAFNGAILERMMDGTLLRHTPIAEHDCLSIWRYLASEADCYAAYTHTTMFYFDASGERLKRRLRAYDMLAERFGQVFSQETVVLDRDEIQPAYADRLLKFVFYEDRPDVVSEYLAVVAEHEHLEAEGTGYGVTGIFDNAVSKRAALEQLQQKLHILPEETIVFGDYDNDASVFACAGMRVAMANAEDVLKRQATHIAASNEEDGVADFLERYVLGNQA